MNGLIPNQRLRSTVSVRLTSGKDVWLTEGSFVKCVQKRYLDKYHPFGDFDETRYTAALTQFGMALIPRGEIDWNVY